MPSKVPCYLRTLRKRWELTQKELSSLVPRCGRVRVSDVERGISVPNGRELLAYAIIFGIAPHDLFPKYASDIEDAVMRGAAKLDRRLAEEDSPAASRKMELLDRMAKRAQSEANGIQNP